MYGNNSSKLSNLVQSCVKTVVQENNNFELVLAVVMLGGGTTRNLSASFDEALQSSMSAARNLGAPQMPGWRGMKHAWVDVWSMHTTAAVGSGVACLACWDAAPSTAVSAIVIFSAQKWTLRIDYF